MILLLVIFTIDPRYHTFQELSHDLDSIATHYPSITHLDTIGFSTRDSLPIFAMKVSNNPQIEEDEPAILYVACHHAEEILGVELCLYMINDLISKYNIDSTITNWVNNREIWFVPLLNVEGREVVMNGIDTIWRKNKRDNNNNGVFDLDGDGVDLNRNYDFYWSGGGSSNPPNEYYRGPAPFSENETRAIRDLALAQHFVFCNSYHSARTGLGQVIYYPYQWSGGYSPDFLCIRQIADSMSKLIINDAGNGHYTALTGMGLEGDERNWFYGVWGTFAYTIEISTTTIQPGWKVDSICQRNMIGAYFLLDRMNYSGITGCIYDSLTNEPLSAEVIINGHYDPNLPPRKSEPNFGRFLRILTPGADNIEISKDGYTAKSFQNVLVTNNALTQMNICLNKIGSDVIKEDYPNRITINSNPAKDLVFIHLDNPQNFTALKIYDSNGRLVTKFDNPAGDLVWQGKDKINRKICDGIYWIVAETAEQKLIKKIIVFN